LVREVTDDRAEVLIIAEWPPFFKCYMEFRFYIKVQILNIVYKYHNEQRNKLYTIYDNLT